MNYILDRGARAPAYLQLYEQIKRDILGGAFPYRSKLPSKRAVAAETGVSTVTVEHAYGLLWAEGYIEGRERSGYFVAFRGEDGFAVSADRVLPPREPAAAGGSIPLFPFTVLAKTMRRVLDDRGEAILQKTPGAGSPELRETLARYLARNRGIFASAEQIVVGSGAESLYGLLTKLFGRDRIFGIESPSYEKIEQIYRASGAECRLLPLGSEGIESSALAATDAQILHVTPYRSFPTGITASASKRHEYVRWADGKGRFLIEDDFESEFSIASKPVETLFALSAKENVVYINTFTKSISPAVRVGYMVLPKTLVPVFDEKLGFCSCSVPTFEQYVIAELLQNGDFERHINRVRRRLRQEAQRDARPPAGPQR